MSKSLKVKSINASSSSRTSSVESTSKHLSDIDIDGEDIKAEEFLANWAAPEVIQDGIHQQASDVYSFSLVLWELLTGQIPFANIRYQDDIRYKVLAGERPD